MTTIVKVENLVKKYSADFIAIDGISFEVKAGECLGILGPNGAGKTSTVKIIQCVSPKDAGVVKVFDTDASLDARTIRARIGVVPQDNELDNDLTLEQNLTLFAALYDIPKNVIQERISKYLSFVQLSERRNSRIDALSGGMKRRLLIARSLLNEPRLLMLDEPTMGLDPQARHLLWDVIRSLKQQQVSMIMTTHYMDEAAILCDRLIIMDKGKILKEGTPHDLVRQSGCANLEEMFLQLTGRELNE